MGHALKAKKGEFTYADYRTWPDGERWELIDGEAYAMSPAPTNHHQLVVGEMFRHIANFLHGKRCRPFVAPFDVRLGHPEAADHLVDTVVQPDISVVCNPEQLKDNRGCRGAPDWVIGVLSPSTALHDQRTKRALYERYGVAEYWLVHPWERSLTVYLLVDGRYGLPDLYGPDDTVSPAAFPDLSLRVADWFVDIPLPPDWDAG